MPPLQFNKEGENPTATKEIRSGGKKQQHSSRDTKTCSAFTKDSVKHPGGALSWVNILLVLPSLKYIPFLSTVPVWGSGIFCPLEKWYFLVPIPTPVFHTVQHYLLQMALTWHQAGRRVPGALTNLQRARHGHDKDHCLIYSLCARLEQVLILAERVSLSLLIVPERLETTGCF